MGIPVYKVLKKCEHIPNGNIWGGYLQPAEIIVLLDAGYNSTTGREIKWAKEDIKAGICNPTWFYFVRNKVKGEWV